MTAAAEPAPAIVAVVAHAKHVPSAARERFAEEAAAATRDPRAIVLHTCHRVELYAARHAAPDDGPVLPAPPHGARRIEGRGAARHLFRVASGLDSVVVGEDQVLHQLRDCIADRQFAGARVLDGGYAGPDHAVAHRRAGLVPELDRLFQLALRVGRQSRAWREGPVRSLADVALDRVADIAGDPAGRQVLVVGAGRMARLAALAAARRGAAVIVTNRDPERAAALAADVDGSTVPFGTLPATISGAVVAIGGPWRLEPEAVRSLGELRPVLVDISSPPALDDDVRSRLDGHYVSVDDIAHGPSGAIADRLRRRIERLIDDADGEFEAWLRGRHAVPAIRALTERAEARRAAEVDHLLRRLPHLAPHDRDLVEQMSRRLVAGLLHAPLTTLRDDPADELERAARDLFAL